MDRSIAVVIATRGRPGLVRRIVDRLERQSRPAARIVVVGASESDIAALDTGRPGLTALVGRPGLCLQRNDGLRHLAGRHAAVAFFDDDFIPSRFWLERAAALFEERPDLTGLTGRVLADGIKTPGISCEDGVARVEAEDAAAPNLPGLQGGFRPYGCNMAFRTEAIQGLAFDERLPLYAWLEDSDFGGQIARAGGRTMRAEGLWGVHLGNKTGRERGRRLGYSQIANPIYLARKGTVSVPFAANLMLRNLAANTLRSLRPEPYIDRPGRLRGNVAALGDILRGRLDPGRAVAL